ncbi:SRPBCC family protein [Herbidospora cretacea]|uniref:SRPBCC family protein n=1 Tax=Herbidospora cretacea TaxID=28444 RepID=UPI0009ED5E92|nr:SRPBCC family protein [Herbidospora cretacea]
MSTIENTVDVDVPIRAAYNQWTQFESFPEFMEGVESVKQLDDRRTHWVVEIAGVRREFDAEITEQNPDHRIEWRSLERPRQSGTVTFETLGAGSCRVTLRMEYDPEGFTETMGDALQIVRMRVKGDLGRFKEFIESRGGETGGWRGSVGDRHEPGGTLPGDTGLPAPGATPGMPGAHGNPRHDDGPPLTPPVV